jgi:hypothetical protein
MFYRHANIYTEELIKYGTIHLFTNSDAILNHDALWVIQGKNPNSKAFNVVLRHNMIIFL